MVLHQEALPAPVKGYLSEVFVCACVCVCGGVITESLAWQPDDEQWLRPQQHLSSGPASWAQTWWPCCSEDPLVLLRQFYKKIYHIWVNHRLPLSRGSPANIFVCLSSCEENAWMINECEGFSRSISGTCWLKIHPNWSSHWLSLHLPGLLKTMMHRNEIEDLLVQSDGSSCTSLSSGPVWQQESFVIFPTAGRWRRKEQRWRQEWWDEWRKQQWQVKTKVRTSEDNVEDNIKRKPSTTKSILMQMWTQHDPILTGFEALVLSNVSSCGYFLIDT